LSTTDSTRTPGSPAAATASDRLDGWKEIAAYLKREVRTVQRWEKSEGLPIHRLQHDKLSTIWAVKTELDDWLKQRQIKPSDPGEEEDEEDRSDGILYDPDPTWPKLRLMALGFLVIAALAYGAYKWSHPSPKPQRKIMLVVLPFGNTSGDASQEYFSDGLTEEMIAQLGKLNPERLGVIARTTSMTYKHTTKTASQIGRELGVDYILEGSVFRSQKRVRITGQLIQVKDQTHVWADTYDRNLSDALVLQSTVAQAVAREVEIKLTPEVQARLEQPRPLNPEAHDAYLKGLDYWNRRTEEGFQESIDYFNQAIARDPNYALAYAGLAGAYGSAGFYGARPPHQVYPQAKQAALRALEIDDTLAEAHDALGDVRDEYDWDFSSAESEYRAAIQFNASDARAHEVYALLLARLGRTDEALAEIRKARQLDPGSPFIRTHLGVIYYYARRFDQALAACQEARDLYPSFALAHMWVGVVDVQKGLYDQGIAELQKSLDLAPGNSYLEALLGYADAVAGRRPAALGVLHHLETLPQQKYVSPAYIGLVYTGLGDKNSAFRWADQALQDRSVWLIYLKAEPMVDTLRSDQRFEHLTRAVGLGL
jgi:TolB-like protein/Flp pilus assembly protein TadD